MTKCRGRLLAALLWAVAMLAPQAGWAWGGEAHRIIALVADRLLAKQAPEVRAKVRQILATDTANELTKTDIASEATWADLLLEKSPEARSATAEWHFARLDFAQPDLSRDCFGRPALPAGYPASHGPRDNCIVDKVEQFSRELRSADTSQFEKLAALQFLLNLVGDLHDPLDVIDHKDMHGDCVALQLPRDRKPVRLSRFWDDILVADALGKDPEAAADRLLAATSAADIGQWSSLGPEAWLQETYAAARAAVYALPAEAAGGNVTLPAASGEKDSCGAVKVYRVDAAYQRRAVETVKTQLAKAGVRLAYMLREDLR